MASDSTGDFRTCQADFDLCANCVHEFRKNDDCTKCEIDAKKKQAQVSWWQDRKDLIFMDVNIGQCLSHSLRGVVGVQSRTDGA